jgi:hypothetical protein
VQNLCVKRFSLAVVVAVAALSPVFAKSQAPAGTAKKPLDVIYVPTPPEVVSEMLKIASVVAVYLLPQLLQRLMPKLRALTPGTRIVSHNYDMGAGWPPDRTIFETDSLIHFWRVLPR